jgi:hypothetical protein
MYSHCPPSRQILKQYLKPGHCTAHPHLSIVHHPDKFCSSSLRTLCNNLIHRIFMFHCYIQFTQLIKLIHHPASSHIHLKLLIGHPTVCHSFFKTPGLLLFIANAVNIVADEADRGLKTNPFPTHNTWSHHRSALFPPPPHLFLSKPVNHCVQ